MTRKLQILRDEYNKLRGEYWLAVLGDDPIRVEFVESEIDKLHTLIVAHETKAMLAAKIKQLERSIEVVYDRSFR